MIVGGGRTTLHAGAWCEARISGRSSLHGVSQLLLFEFGGARPNDASPRPLVGPVGGACLETAPYLANAYNYEPINVGFEGVLALWSCFEGSAHRYALVRCLDFEHYPSLVP